MKIHMLVPSGGIAQRLARWQAACAKGFGAAGILVQVWATRPAAPAIRIFMVFL